MTQGFIVGFLILSTILPVFAELDIVPVDKEMDESTYVLKDMTHNKVLGTFWDPVKGHSDYGYYSTNYPKFLWSKSRDYVAVSGGAPRCPEVYLYKVAGDTLKKITIPELTEKQATRIHEIDNLRAGGTNAIRWQPDGKLLLRFWAQERVTAETVEEPKRAEVWALIEVTDSTAKIVSTSEKEPSEKPTPLPAKPALESHGKPGK